MPLENESHFLEKYLVHKKPEAIKAAQRKQRREKRTDIVSNPTKRVEAYLEHLKNFFLHPDPSTRQLYIKSIKPKIYKNTIIKKEKFPENYFTYKKQLLINQGYTANDADEFYDQKQRAKEIEDVIEKQKISLDAWIDYLTSNDCKSPADIKYFAMQGILKLGDFDPIKYKFSKREPSTATSYHVLDRTALSIVMGAMQAKYYHEPTQNYSSKLLELIDQKSDFGKLYAQAMFEQDQKLDKTSLLPITTGRWITYLQGSDPQELVNALSNQRSNLCLADIGSATQYLKESTIEIYFSHDQNNNPTIARLAIAHDQKNGVSQVRGTYNKNEDIDPYISQTNILHERLKDLPNGESFAYKDECMKKMTQIYNKCFLEDKDTKTKTYLNPALNKEELTFLYEINDKIQGFGYQADPRIKGIISNRNVKADISMITGFSENQISITQEEALEGSIEYHYGDLNLDGLTSAKDLTLPNSISGDLNLDGLTSAKDLTLPTSIGDRLFLRGLTSVKGLTLPNTISSLYLSSLTSAKDLTLPNSIGSNLDLSRLTSAKDLTLPTSIGDSLYLNGLTSAKDLTLPTSIGGNLDLRGLTSAKDLSLPTYIGGILNLSSLTSAEKEELRIKNPHLASKI